MKRVNVFNVLIMLAAFSLTACSKQTANEPAAETMQEMSHHDEQTESIESSDEDFFRDCRRFSWATAFELQAARLATLKYRNFDRAIADGYADINVVMPNMGFHYMKSTLVDGKFEITKPEILVYNKLANGKWQLVAIEYAVPIDITPNKAPKGFTGNADVWDRNTGFGLWLLHAWIYKHNPDGIFNPTNPLVHVKM